MIASTVTASLVRCHQRRHAAAASCRRKRVQNPPTLDPPTCARESLPHKDTETYKVTYSQHVPAGMRARTRRHAGSNQTKSTAPLRSCCCSSRKTDDICAANEVTAQGVFHFLVHTHYYHSVLDCSERLMSAVKSECARVRRGSWIVCCEGGKRQDATVSCGLRRRAHTMSIRNKTSTRSRAAIASVAVVWQRA